MCGETVIWHPASGRESTDVYGRQHKMFGADKHLAGVLVAPGTPGPAGEPRQRHSYRVVTSMTIYLPSNPGVGDADEFTVRGRRYQVEGTPADWVTGLTGRGFGVEVALRNIKG